ncbi:MAG TPA: prepilin-type N-terminal cleavage/methylation domain-containing protein [Candidatus Hydrogenedentes bacterium]|nr:prepilin-type N-terminal cleavage/methylation domain-containing protein [Candidatus Hydrogenedentota bacterium]HOS03910.1 prepilin-type N-terminal cleavage/methylation domain-containing protein [Candidatus Hydrogenedentota bacterium]
MKNENNRGMTLLEVVVSMAILTMVSGVLFLLSDSIGRAARVQNAQIAAQDDTRTAMAVIVRELLSASMASINTPQLPGDVLTYRKAMDVDGNGSAVNVGVRLELGPVCQIRRDLNDLNGDGLTRTQLVLVQGNTVRVLANGLFANEDANQNGVLNAGEDANGNGRLDQGVWFRPRGSGMVITLQTERRADIRGRTLRSDLEEFVVPRN